MYLLEEPFVSELLADSARRSRRQVLDTPMARRHFHVDALTDGTRFAETAGRSGARLYANSENALDWVHLHLGQHPVAGAVAALKDKVRFRELLADLDPDYAFTEVPAAALDDFDPRSLPAPFVIKPAAGFFSLGVHIVSQPDEWSVVRGRIARDRARFANLYPSRVLDLDRWVAEQVIEGDEFAVDVYYRTDGEAVVLGILEHPFAHGADVSDRVYRTSAGILDRYLARFEEYLQTLGARFGLRDFPMHIELRVDSDGRIRPIEANPLRFGGWCAADMAFHAWGFDPYQAYLEDRRPDWDTLLSSRRDRVYALVVADLPADVDRERVDIDFERFGSRFSRVLELRRVEDRRHPVFAFAFVEVERGREGELEEVLGADLREYTRPRSPGPVEPR